MKKIIILLSVIMFASCSLFDNGEKDIEAINKAEQTAKANINSITDQEIIRAKKEIDNAVSSVVSRADSTLTKQINTVEKMLSTKAEETKKELSGKISGIEDNITEAKVISFIGLVIGILGVFLAFIAYKRPRTNMNRVKGLIWEEINSNDFILDEIRKIVGEQNSSYRPQENDLSKKTIEQVIETYITSKKFRDIIEQYMSSLVVKPQEVVEVQKTERSVTPVVKALYQIYAKESNSMFLSNIQDTYQKGKSIYKLTMSEPNASTAKVTVCIEQEEVKQRILKFDSQYLEPICSVTRLSNEPTQVIIKTAGTAELIGEEWKVIIPIKVEIK